MESRCFYGKQLNRQSKQMYCELYRKFAQRDYSGRITLDLVDAGRARNDFREAYRALRDDFPEFFFMGKPMEMVRRGSRTEFVFQILYSIEDIRRTENQLRRRICETVKGTDGLDQIDAEKVIYERIAGSMTYRNHKDCCDHNIVGPVFINAGVCEGMNALLMLCLRRAGIPCIKVYGLSSNQEHHCWTIAWINNVPVHLDVTWDVGKTGGFTYFNLSDRQIGKTHTGFRRAHIPECSNESYNYNRHFGYIGRTRRFLMSLTGKQTGSRK